MLYGVHRRSVVFEKERDPLPNRASIDCTIHTIIDAIHKTIAASIQTLPITHHTTPREKKTVGKGLLHHPILPSHENNPSRFQHLSTSFPPHLLPPTPRVTRLPGLLPHLKTRPPPRPPPQPQMLIRRTRGIEIQSLHPAITPPETDIIEPTDRESVPAVLIPSPRVRGTRVVG